MARPKGLPKSGGRQKGTPNKQTAALKDMILGALDDAGGRDYLKRQANENPTAFMSLIGRVLPTTLAGDKENPLHVEHSSAAREKVASGVAELAARFGTSGDPEQPNGRAVH